MSTGQVQGPGGRAAPHLSYDQTWALVMWTWQTSGLLICIFSFAPMPTRIFIMFLAERRKDNLLEPRLVH